MEFRLIIMALICLCIAQLAFAAEDSYPFASAQLQQRFVKLTKELRCAKCQNQSLYESNASLAVDMRNKIYNMLNSGLSDAAVREFMSHRYGDYVLFNPPMRPNTWMLWVGPLMMLGLGMLFIYRNANY